MGCRILTCCGGRNDKMKLDSKTTESKVHGKERTIVDTVTNTQMTSTYTTNENSERMSKNSSLINKNLQKKYVREKEFYEDFEEYKYQIMTSREYRKLKTMPLKYFHENENISQQPIFNEKINREINRHFRARSRNNE